MGCGISKIDPSGATTLPAKLRPIFLRRLEEIKKRRHAQPLKDSTPSKKGLLLHDRDEEDNASHFSSSEYDTSKNVPSPTKDGADPSKNDPLPTGDGANYSVESLEGKEPTKPTGKDGMLIEFTPKIRVDKTNIDDKIENILTVKDGSEDDQDEEHDKERMISHQDDDAFPGSPSFRIYFTDGDQIDNIRKNDALRDAGLSDEKTSLKVLPVKKEPKRGRKMQSFRKVLPKGGQLTVKNLLNVKSCYNSSHSARDRAHLLTAKTV